MKKKQKSSTATSENGETEECTPTRKAEKHLLTEKRKEEEKREEKNKLNVLRTERRARKQEESSSEGMAERLKSHLTKDVLSRVAKTFQKTDVHVEMASDLLVNLANREGGIVRFQEKGARRSKNET